MTERGQSLVEFTISLIILLFLFAGMVELGIALFQYVQLRDAAQEGALYGSACECSVTEIENRAINSSSTPINLLLDPGVNVTVEVRDENGNLKPSMCEKDALTVHVSYAHKIFMPFVPKLIGSDYIYLRAYVTDTVLRPICHS